MNLRQWYTDIPKIRSLLFVSGTDDLALVENGGNVRIFSLVTQMFRFVLVNVHVFFEVITDHRS